MKRYAWQILVFAQAVFTLSSLSAFAMPASKPANLQRPQMQQVNSSLTNRQPQSMRHAPALRPNAAAGFKTILLSHPRPAGGQVTGQVPQFVPGLADTQ